MSDTTLLSSWLSPEKGDEVLLFLHPNVSRRKFRKLCLAAASQLSNRSEKVIAFSFTSRVLAAAAFVGALAAGKIPALFPGKRTNLIRMRDCFDLILPIMIQTLKSNFYGKQVRPLLRISMKSSSVQKTSFFSLLLALLVNRRLFSRLWDKWTKRQELLLSCLAISAEITLLLPPQTSVTCMP